VVAKTRSTSLPSSLDKRITQSSLCDYSATAALKSCSIGCWHD